MQASIGNVAEFGDYHSNGLHFPKVSLHNMYYSLLNTNSKDKAPCAPELIRRARMEILHHDLNVPLVMQVYAAYAYLMMHYPKVSPQDRAKHLMEHVKI